MSTFYKIKAKTLVGTVYGEYDKKVYDKFDKKECKSIFKKVEFYINTNCILKLENISIKDDIKIKSLIVLSNTSTLPLGPEYFYLDKTAETVLKEIQNER